MLFDLAFQMKCKFGYMYVLLEGVVWVLAEEDVEIQDAPYRPVRNGRIRRGLQRHLYK